MAEGKGKKSGKKRNNGFEVRVIETRYGLKVLVRQGDQKVWLNERHLNILFQALLARVFGEGRRAGKRNGSSVRNREGESGENDS